MSYTVAVGVLVIICIPSKLNIKQRILLALIVEIVFIYPVLPVGRSKAALILYHRPKMLVTNNCFHIYRNEG